MHNWEEAVSGEEWQEGKEWLGKVMEAWLGMTEGEVFHKQLNGRWGWGWR